MIRDRWQPYALQNLSALPPRVRVGAIPRLLHPKTKRHASRATAPAALTRVLGNPGLILGSIQGPRERQAALEAVVALLDKQIEDLRT